MIKKEKKLFQGFVVVTMFTMLVIVLIAPYIFAELIWSDEVETDFGLTPVGGNGNGGNGDTDANWCEDLNVAYCNKYTMLSADEDIAKLAIRSVERYLEGRKCGGLFESYLKEDGSNCDVTVTDCRCEWENGECLSKWNKTDSCKGTFGICAYTTKDAIDDCNNSGWMTFSLEADWAWTDLSVGSCSGTSQCTSDPFFGDVYYCDGANCQLDTGCSNHPPDCNNIIDELGGAYICESSICNPANCISKDNVRVRCREIAKLGFFSLPNLIVVILIIIAIYIIYSLVKSKKKVRKKK